MAIKDEHLALSSGIILAGKGVRYIEELDLSDLKEGKDYIISSIIKPNKVTAVHMYLSRFQNINEEIDNLLKYELLDMEDIFEFILKTLEEVNMYPGLPDPNFEDCPHYEGHFNCKCYDKVMKWINYIRDNEQKINSLIVHSAFQIVFRDKKFLLKFHKKLAEFVYYFMDEIDERYSDNVTQNDRIKRVSYYPKWLTDALFYRDMGTCSNPECRCDLSNLIRSQNTIHIDHIIPLKKYGSNDASNFQLLCETCNTSKGAKILEASSISVPFWNLE
jgi:hypothetical protein